MARSGSNSLPITIIVLAVLTVLAWKVAPHARKFIRSQNRGRMNQQVVSEPLPTPLQEVREDSVQQDEPVANVSGSDEPAAKVCKCDIDNAQWGVLRNVTEVKSHEAGNVLGTVKGGRFFTINRRARIDGEIVCVGNFTPKAMDEMVFVPQASLIGFTGAPDDLNAQDAQLLREYYELEGDILERAKKINLEFAEKSPYAKEAVAALKRLKELTAESRKKGNESSDAQRSATYEISVLQTKIKELNRQHKAWKAGHAGEAPDPEKDAEVIDMRKRQDLVVKKVSQELKIK